VRTKLVTPSVHFIKNKTLCLPYYAYVFSSTKLEMRGEQDLPGNKGSGEGEGRGGGQGGEMTQTVNK
jgi:hypothetical protein